MSKQEEKKRGKGGLVIVPAGLLAAGAAVYCIVAKPFANIPNQPDTTTAVTTAAADAAQDAAAETTTAAQTDAAQTEAVTGSDEGGGNAAEKTVIAITVSEQKYLCDNKEMSADEIGEMLDKAEPGTEVVLTDDKGTVNAFEALQKILDEKHIPYTVSNN